jgi:hypothetical protein
MASPPPSTLPKTKTLITGHGQDGKAVVKKEVPAAFTSFNEGNMGFCVSYTTSEFPVDLHDDGDIKTHEEKMSTGKLGWSP